MVPPKLREHIIKIKVSSRLVVVQDVLGHFFFCRSMNVFYVNMLTIIRRSKLHS